MSRYIDAEAMIANAFQDSERLYLESVAKHTPSIDLDDYVPKEFHNKTCEAMAKRHQEEILKLMANRKTEPQTITMVKDHGRKQALEMINLYHELKTEPQTKCDTCKYDNCDPVDIHDAISKGASRIETVMREESAKITEILYKDVHKKYDTFCGVPMEEAIEVILKYKKEKNDGRS